eukprot:1692363-Amphidinium_carterae.1
MLSTTFITPSVTSNGLTAQRGSELISRVTRESMTGEYTGFVSGSVCKVFFNKPRRMWPGLVTSKALLGESSKESTMCNNHRRTLNDAPRVVRAHEVPSAVDLLQPVSGTLSLRRCQTCSAEL